MKAAKEHSKTKKRRTEALTAAAAEASGPLLEVVRESTAVTEAHVVTPEGSTSTSAGSIRYSSAVFVGCLCPLVLLLDVVILHAFLTNVNSAMCQGATRIVTE